MFRISAQDKFCFIVEYAQLTIDDGNLNVSKYRESFLSLGILSRRSGLNNHPRSFSGVVLLLF